MAKYKLIKIYPKSPPLGTIVEVGNDGYLTYRMRNDYNREITSIHESVLTEYSEFWEEVVEKEYEILAFKQQGNYTFTKDDSGKFYRDKDTNLYSFTDKQVLKLTNINIHSVRRLSDGEVFTVGDKIKLNQVFSKQRTITEIDIDKNNNAYLHHETGYITIKNAIKLKQPLFTTEDGVDIYEGDNIWCVSNELDDLHDPYFLYEGLARDSKPDSIEVAAYFSTKEAAEEYILINKPCLSIADIYNHFNGQWSKCSSIVHLKELVKSKL